MSDVPRPDELFPDETPGGVPPTPRRSRKAFRLFLLVVLLGASGGFWYTSVQNHERFFLAIDDGVLTVERGLWFPFGTREWQPSVAYAPMPLPPDMRPDSTGPMTASELDGALLKLFVGIAERELGDLEKGDVGRAEDALLRAGKLARVGPEDTRRVQGMIGDAHYRRGLAEVRGLQARFDEALRQFEQASAQGGERFRDPGRWVLALRRQREEFRRLAIDSGLDPDKALSAPIAAPPPAPATEPAE